ncbi:MAG: DUF4982 domain-containing protein [Bacteroidales bacterium]|nr:DUF4982 domain-containing protein [Bacteroidales bacterium]
MKRVIFFLAAVVLLTGCRADISPRCVQDFNFDWYFALGDSPEFAEAAEPMEAPAWSRADFDDSAWRPLHLPHDWAVEGEFSATNPSGPGSGALPGGIGWYRKRFVTPEGDLHSIEFDGVFMNSTVYLNGHALGTRPYGYSSFSYDLTPYLRPVGEENIIAVRCDNADQPNSRWYAGCGIYRDVRLVSTASSRVAYNGVFLKTRDNQVDVSVTLEGEAVDLVRFEILDPQGRCISETTTKTPSLHCTATVDAPNPRNWDIDDPALYTLVVSLIRDERVIDRYEQRFGFRTIAWDKDTGFYLNGRNVKLLGVCLHHDMGCLGSAVHRRALERELTILKEMGVNAVRTSHNPPAPQLLELCDEMGLMVMDEAFDMWRRRKTRFDYSRFFDEWSDRDLTDFIIRDRNHPSIILWSIGNEIPEQTGRTPEEIEANMETARHLADLVNSLDGTRLVTSGCDHVNSTNNILRSGAVDIVGLNYRHFLYDSVRVWYADMPIIGSETVSSLNSRGVYKQPSTRIETYGWPREQLSPDSPFYHQCTAYDASHASWSALHEEAWIAVRDRDWVGGTFMWTGFDYLGEPTPYGWPSRSSYFGIVDLAGFPKDPYWLYRSEWTDETTLHLFPHWNWAPGDSIDLWAYYNNADEVELLVNGKSLGRKAKTDSCLHVIWPQVPFEPGRIEAVSYKDGRRVASEVHETTGPAVKLRLTPDRSTIAADGYDLSYVTVEALDAQGRVVPDAGTMLEFRVKGKGELAGIDNGNAADTLSLKGTRKAMFNGKALAVVRSLKDEKGAATLTVSSALGETSVQIRTR